MDIDAEIKSGKVVIAHSLRLGLECLFEVDKVLGLWVRPLEGTIYVVRRSTKDSKVFLTLVKPNTDESTIADLTVFRRENCQIPHEGLLDMYEKLPLV